MGSSASVLATAELARPHDGSDVAADPQAEVVRLRALLREQMELNEAQAAEQQKINSVGSAIATKVPIEVQKRLHSWEFIEMVEKEWAAADADGNGSLEIDELIVAMGSVKEKLELKGPTPTLPDAQAAMQDFDRDGSGAIEADEFPMLVKVLVLALTIDLPVSSVAAYIIAAEEAREEGQDAGTLPVKPAALPPIGGGGGRKLKLRALKPPMPSIGEEEEEEEEGGE